ncbi:MAG: S-methyl-5-thioribose-1-phosphate isomerase [Candidatus Krumholzibacteriota bacterium]|nr:S-methyl-5-thioribose-1-phosphate isomerase [Candidatus Krumholzibacteriota bacterium]
MIAGIPPNLEYRRGVLRILDQTRLPWEETHVEARDAEAVAAAIGRLAVRGAPAIGIAAGYGLCVALADLLARDPEAGLTAAREALADARARLGAARPTAVNLPAALTRLERAESAFCRTAAKATAGDLLDRLEAEAAALHRDERQVCEDIAAAGLSLLPEAATLVTHCNAGPLATGGIGTALGVILRGHERGRRFTVYAGETRPLLQGARLTAWELGKAGVPVRLMPDGAGPGLILAGKVDAVIVGADRVAANGDTANKLGTLPLALAAARAGTPFYVAAPWTSFDPSAPDGAAVPIEERGAEEVTHLAGRATAAPGAAVYNPAFDVTPGDLVTAFLTERGVLRPPYAFGRDAECDPA